MEVADADITEFVNVADTSNSFLNEGDRVEAALEALEPRV